MAAGDFPILHIYSFDTSEVADPVGQRHVPGGSFAFKRRISLGCSTFDEGNPGGSSGVLEFEGIKFNAATPSSDVASKVSAVIVRTAVDGTAVSNMRLYVVDNSALLAGVTDTGTEPARLQFAASGIWQPNPTWPSGIHAELPTSIPSNANVLRQDGGSTLLGTNDFNVSQYVYLNVVAPLGFPLGEFGGCGSGLLRLGLVFDYYDDSYVLQFGDPSL